jgi:hypothetical protein
MSDRRWAADKSFALRETACESGTRRSEHGTRRGEPDRLGKAASTTAVERVEAVADRGLRGDRYFRGSGYYSGVDGCQVTFVGIDALASVREESGVDLADGRHRRNIVVDTDVTDLLEHRFRVGEAVFKGTRLRPPCAHLEELAGEAGVARALGGARRHLRGRDRVGDGRGRRPSDRPGTAVRRRGAGRGDPRAHRAVRAKALLSGCGYW